MRRRWRLEILDQTGLGCHPRGPSYDGRRCDEQKACPTGKTPAIVRVTTQHDKGEIGGDGDNDQAREHQQPQLCAGRSGCEEAPVEEVGRRRRDAWRLLLGALAG